MSWINNNKFDKQTNIGFPATFLATDKFPLIDKRIFLTKEAAETYISNPTSSAIPGLILRVIEDNEANNGAYLVEKDGETKLKLKKFSTGDISTFLKSSLISSNDPLDDSTLIILSTNDNNGSIFNSSIKITGNNYVKITGSPDNIIISASTATLVDASNGSTGLSMAQDVYKEIVTVENVIATTVVTMAETLGMDNSLGVEWSEESGIPEGTDYKTAIEQYSGKTYTAGDNIYIDSSNIISATFTTATIEQILDLFIEHYYTIFTYSNETTSVTENSVISSESYSIPEGYDLIDVKFSNNVETISDNAFLGCSELGYNSEIIIPDSVKAIGSNAFKGCTSMESISIGSGVNNIGNTPFSGCENLTSVSIDANGIVSKDYGSQYFKNVFGNQVTEYIIGNNVTRIGNSTFEDCTELTSIIIPDSVISIGNWSFSGCTGLTSVTIGNSVTSIGEHAFENCTGLTSATIPNSVTSIRDSAFYGCTGLTSVTIGNSVTNIGSSAFSGCTNLVAISIPESVTNIGDDALSISSNEATRNIYLESSIPVVLTNPQNHTIIKAFGDNGSTYTLGINIYVPSDAYLTYLEKTDPTSELYDAGWEYYKNNIRKL